MDFQEGADLLLLSCTFIKKKRTLANLTCTSGNDKAADFENDWDGFTDVQSGNLVGCCMAMCFLADHVTCPKGMRRCVRCTDLEQQTAQHYIGTDGLSQGPTHHSTSGEREATTET